MIIIRHMEDRMLHEDRGYIFEQIRKDLFHEIGHWYSIDRKLIVTGYFSSMLGALLSAISLILLTGWSIMLPVIGELGYLYVLVGGCCLVYMSIQGREAKAIAFQAQMDHSIMGEELTTCIRLEDDTQQR